MIIKYVDPIKVLDSLMNTFQGQTLMVPTKKIKIESEQILADIEIGSNGEFPVYESVNNSGQKIRIFTINHKLYNSMKESKCTSGFYDESALKNLGLECDWCRDDFNDIPWQIPIEMVTIRNEERQNNIEEIIFHGDGKYCSKECMYAGYISSSDHYKREGYQEINSLIKHLCLCRNESNPIPAPPWQLYCKNGGPLSERDFHNNKTIYYSMPNIIVLPIKRQYYTFSA